MDKLQVFEIIEGTAVDGPGLRTAIYFSGCSHKCPGCQNPQTWDFNAGRLMSIDEIMEVVERNGFNVTFSGGDPLFQIKPLTELAKRIHASGKTIWCYTGFTYDVMLTLPNYSSLLSVIDVLVDGAFVKELADVSLPFRGSSNQRLIDCRLSEAGNIVLYQPDLY